MKILLYFTKEPFVPRFLLQTRQLCEVNQQKTKDFEFIKTKGFEFIKLKVFQKARTAANEKKYFKHHPACERKTKTCHKIKKTSNFN